MYFLNLLNRPGGYIMNMTARIVAKLACWSREKMVGSDLQFYITWLKDQLKMPVRIQLSLCVGWSFKSFHFRTTSTSRVWLAACR